MTTIFKKNVIFDTKLSNWLTQFKKIIMFVNKDIYYGQGSNLGPCIYYVLSSTELSSRGQIHLSKEKLILSQDLWLNVSHEDLEWTQS